MEILERYRQFKRTFTHENTMANHGLGLMSECERQFLLMERAITTKDGVDAIHIDTFYLQDPKGIFTKLSPGISAYAAEKEAGQKGMKCCGVAEKWCEWYERHHRHD